MSKMHFKIIALSLFFGFSSLAFAGDPFWIDVRSASEYSEGHVEQAVNIPHNEIADEIAALNTNKDATIYVYCRSGRRSGMAKETLESMGYTQVTNLGGLEDALARAAQEAGQ